MRILEVHDVTGKILESRLVWPHKKKAYVGNLALNLFTPDKSGRGTPKIG